MRAHGVRRLPVVGSAGSTVGIITLDDMLRLLVAEAGELLETMAKAERREQHTRR
jgi:CBS domain-containing protein